MSKIVDITDKLEFEENPKIKIKDTELELNSDAETVIKLMALTEGEITNENIIEMCDIIFTAEAKKQIKALKLSFKDYVKVVQQAVSLVTGTNEDQGEVTSPTTI